MVMNYFCEEKFHAANGKAPTCSQGALISFLLRRGRGVGGGSFQRVVLRDFFKKNPWFPMCSYYVTVKFPMGS
jgi:hypothetical protein